MATKKRPSDSAVKFPTTAISKLMIATPPVEPGRAEASELIVTSAQCGSTASGSGWHRPGPTQLSSSRKHYLIVPSGSFVALSPHL